MRLGSIFVVALLLVACTKEQGTGPGKEPAKEPPPSVEPKSVDKPSEEPPKAGEAVEAEKTVGEAVKVDEAAGKTAGRTAGETAERTPEAGKVAAAEAGKAGEAVAPEVADGQAKSTLPDLAKSALPYLPEQLQAVVALDLVGAVTRLDSVMPLVTMLGVAQDKALQEELSAFVRSRIGLDPLAARGVIIAITAEPAFWVLVKGDFKLDKASSADFVDVAGMKALVQSGDVPFVVLPLEGWGLALFDRQEAAVVFAEKILARKGPPATEPELLASLGDVPGAIAAVAVDFSHPMIQAGWSSGIPFPPPRLATLHVDSRSITAKMVADEACINGILGALEKVRAEAKAAVAAQKANLAEMNLADGMALIIADRSLDRLIQFITPKRSGENLTLSLAIDEFTTVSLVGTMAAVAIPAFLKYSRETKVSEAQENLRKIRFAAEDYYCTPRLDEQGNAVPPRFPDAQATTPAAGTCCAEPGGPAGTSKGKCDPDSSIWETPTWTALHFTMLDPHYFAYEFTPKAMPDGTQAFDVSAYGDLDCNGVRSTFRMSCQGIPGGEDGCRLNCDPVHVENEIE